MMKSYVSCLGLACVIKVKGTHGVYFLVSERIRHILGLRPSIESKIALRVYWGFSSSLELKANDFASGGQLYFSVYP